MVEEKENPQKFVHCLVVLDFFFLNVKSRSFISFCKFWSSFRTSAGSFVSDLFIMAGRRTKRLHINYPLCLTGDLVTLLNQ